MEKQTKAQTIAESYINGNLSWVKNECKKNVSLIAEVITELKQYNKDQADNFINWLKMW